MNYTQPLCDTCWVEREGNRVPVRTAEPQEERCCCCGGLTESGIYQRIDPRSVTFPKMDDDE